MNTEALKNWAVENGDNGEVIDGTDRTLGIPAWLLRFRWNGTAAISVGCERSQKDRINAVLDGIVWFLHNARPGDHELHLILGAPFADDRHTDSAREQLGAIGTLVAELSTAPAIFVWRFIGNREPEMLDLPSAQFSSETAVAWNQLLLDAAVRLPTGFAARMVEKIDHPSFSLYPKLTERGSMPWQMRLDGLDIGRAGASGAVLKLATRNVSAPGEPRDTWRAIVGSQPRRSHNENPDELPHLVNELIAAWSDSGRPGSVLQHGQPEHGLEAHVLTGRLLLETAQSGPLEPTIPPNQGVVFAGQFPTLWGDAAQPARYLDALLADVDRRPWAVELKEQFAGGGHGKYLRDGIAQAVLYRHFIRSAEPLDPYFDRCDLRRSECQGALAFPTASARARATVQRHHDLARRFDIEVIEFDPPGINTP